MVLNGYQESSGYTSLDTSSKEKMQITEDAINAGIVIIGIGSPFALLLFYL